MVLSFYLFKESQAWQGGPITCLIGRWEVDNMKMRFCQFQNKETKLSLSEPQQFIKMILGLMILTLDHVEKNQNINFSFLQELNHDQIILFIFYFLETPSTYVLIW